MCGFPQLLPTPYTMSDGPNHEANFQAGILNAEANLKDIVRFLRFYKGEDKYQSYLRQYLPMLAKLEYTEVFDEFIDDYENEERVKELKTALKAPKVEEPVESVEGPVEEAVNAQPEEFAAEPVESVETSELEAPKKRGRKPKNA